MTFEEQFKNKIKVETLGGIIDAVDIHPDINITDNKDNYPVFISSGWASTFELLKPLLKTIFENNRRVIAVDFKHLDHIENGGEKYNTRASLKAKAIIDTIEKLGLEKVDIIGHSEGAVNATFAVEISPEKFRNLLLVAPAGMIPNQPFSKMVLSFIVDTVMWPIKKIKGNNRPFYHILQNIKFIMENPIQSTQEGYGLSKIYIGKKVSDLMRKGVFVRLIYFNDDIFFPLDLVEKTAEENNIPFSIVEGTHNYIYSKPDVFLKKINNFLK